MGKARKIGDISREMLHLVLPFAAPTTDVVQRPEHDNCPVMRDNQSSAVFRVAGTAQREVIIKRTRNGVNFGAANDSIKQSEPAALGL